MGLYLVTVLVLLAVLSGWLWWRKQAHDFAQRHPEFGPARVEGEGCGACAGDSCAGKCH